MRRDLLDALNDVLPEDVPATVAAEEQQHSAATFLPVSDWALTLSTRCNEHSTDVIVTKL
jgi:hypothetical protein